MTYKHSSLLIIVALVLLAASQSYAYPITSPVDLGTAGNFTILAETGISTTKTTKIVGDIGVSAAAATYLTGFGQIMDGSGTFSTSTYVTGKIYAADYTPTTPAYLTTAVSDMQAAYTDAAGRGADFLGVDGGILGVTTLVPGVYKWTTGVTIPTDLTLSGGAGDVWIFQIAGTLAVGSGTKVILIGGAQANNIFWAVADVTTLYSMSEFKGTILDQTLIAMQDGATLDGRALAQTAVTLIGNTVVPEPCTILLLGSGLAGLFASRRSRSAA
ncbi:MAG: DUF3494 domain-containing protein [Planctomycetes bacterium]|nr:DUF3494 domain-containing protein [Planctomycetota bacterium]